MIKHAATVAALAGSLALPAMADDHASGDAAAGEKAFRACKACHMIESPDETIVRGGRVGPNLYGVVGRTAGSAEDFNYSGLMATAGAQGLAWDEQTFVAYVQAPTGYLQEQTGESGRGKMAYKVRSKEDAVDLWAYLASVSPEPGS